MQADYASFRLMKAADKSTIYENFWKPEGVQVFSAKNSICPGDKADSRSQGLFYRLSLAEFTAFHDLQHPVKYLNCLIS